MVTSTVEKLTPTRVKLHITVTPDELKPSIAHAYEHIAKDVQIPGFRKGKVPAPIIDQRIGRGAVLEHAVSEGLDGFYRQAVEAESIRVLGRPSAEVVEWPAEKDFSGDLEVDVEVDVRPEFDLPAYEGLTIEVDAVASPVSPERETYVAEATAARLNTMLDEAGFYVGDERVVPIEASTLASWITLSPGERGTLDIAVDESAVQEVVDTLPEAVNRDPVNNKILVNMAGTTLAEENEGTVGRELETTDGIAAGFSEQVATANGAYQLPVVETPYETAEVVRLLEVDLSSQMLYLKENDRVVDSWAISSGQSNTPTYTGRYTVHAHLTSQTMRGSERDANGDVLRDANGDPVTYTTPDVKWVMYFNGDQAFHGVYWHSNWGTPMSHGCVGMPEWRAEQIFNWTANGTDVWIHA